MIFLPARGMVMMYFFRVFDPAIVAILLVPICLAIAAWALRLACSFSSVEPPEFLQSAFTVVLICVANVAVSFFMHFTQAAPGIGTHLVVPLLVTAAMIAIVVRTGPLSALITTVSFGSICGGVYYSLAALNAAMLAKLIA